MAKPFTRVVLKAVSGLLATHYNRIICASVYHNGIKYSTLPNDPGSHEEFKATGSLEDYHISVKNDVEKDIKDNSVMIYMKGVPEMPRCGFSSLAVRVLKLYDVPFGARNILENPEMKTAVKSVSHWPTFPQIFIKGEFIGGSDIILNMHQSGELKEKLKDVAVAVKQDESQ